MQARLTVRQDVRYARRMMRRAPVFTAIAVLSLALGIGATTTVFTLVNSLMFHACRCASLGSWSSCSADTRASPGRTSSGVGRQHGARDIAAVGGHDDVRRGIARRLRAGAPCGASSSQCRRCDMSDGPATAALESLTQESQEVRRSTFF